jgi:hypothetical protein
MIIFVDIDETICNLPEKRDYSKAVPIKENIEKINELFNKGDTIIYWTARGSTTGTDWSELTKNQLKEWGAMHHEVRLNKPYYNLFICDKTKRIEEIQ